MLHELTDARISDFQTACAYERVFGSRALTLLRTYGLEDSPARFYLCERDGCPTAALSLLDGVLTARPIFPLGSCTQSLTCSNAVMNTTGRIFASIRGLRT